MKKVFISGITGQDGIFLTKEILVNNPNAMVIGATRNTNNELFYERLKGLDIDNFSNIKLVTIDLNNFTEVNKLITDVRPDAVFNLAGPSSVNDSIKNPSLGNEIINIYTNITNSLIADNNFCKFFQASSSEIFYESIEPLNENSKFYANSPYAKAKIQCHEAGKELAKKYDWQIVSGILFNHESEFRNKDFLVTKIIDSAIRISRKQSRELTVGSLDLKRDWSYASDIVKGFYDITENGMSYSYVLGSGNCFSIKDILDMTFSFFSLDWKDYIEINPQLLRKGDPLKKVANIDKIHNETGWSPEISLEKTLEIIIKSKLRQPITK